MLLFVYLFLTIPVIVIGVEEGLFPLNLFGFLALMFWPIYYPVLFAIYIRDYLNRRR